MIHTPFHNVDNPAEPSTLAAARVAQLLLAEHEHVDHRDLFAVNRAHGALAEAIRILLRAVGTNRGDTATVGPRPVPAPRCPAAHPDDPTPCDGPPVVTVLDVANAGADGCEHHGARLLASLDGGRVYPLPDAPEGAAIRVFTTADTTRPFIWVNSARTRDEQLSRAEARARGEGQ
ncbi:hypothetical protein [Streptomyces rhizosphaerihabitans]|uniref:hypothetical protein n=1 Tax=Streptomyces rhizosphaerihabitans TaxID=1266770 RepID=UPI0021BE7AFA|nr:hypothetical protein [Streptomyces rhizosphaerihabitans]MCT9009993.1 hypothetical protein [Streptomyces rhizosphaerihabitans]